MNKYLCKLYKASLIMGISSKPLYAGTEWQGLSYRAVRSRTAWYIPIRQLTNTRTTRYQAVPPKSTIDGRFKEKSTVGGRLKEKKGRRKRKGEEDEKKKEVEDSYLISPRCPRLRAITAHALSSPAGYYSPGEKDRDDFTL
ncbi:hypothetical protein BHM03_00059219, partial [Ensete ventricosum]